MNNLAIQFIIQIVTFGVFAVGMIMGSEVSEQGNITKGRNEGIILCSEKPEQCKIEYNYLNSKRLKNEQPNHRSRSKTNRNPTKERDK